jgi:hypothetical protein
MFNSSGKIFELESGILQLRKAMECIAYSSISPNITAYKEFREKADKNKDYRKDFNGNKMLKALGAINKDFYPIALKKPTNVDGIWNFGRNPKIFTRKEFEKLYDRLGKFLHADNPWGTDKFYQALAKELPDKINNIQSMLALYMTVIRTPNFKGVWVIEIINGVPSITVAKADGEFSVK